MARPTGEQGVAGGVGRRQPIAHYIMKGIGGLESVYILSIGLGLQEDRAGIHQDRRPQNVFSSTTILQTTGGWRTDDLDFFRVLLTAAANTQRRRKGPRDADKGFAAFA